MWKWVSQYQERSRTKVMNETNGRAYEMIQQEELKGIRSRGCLLRHKKSGARVLLIENDDDNKVFSIGFRTPPKDSTGVPHIMEHSVLCGSKNFPAKDPFVELVKGSLNTFLNAMTYPDKTVYPVASCNDKDFQNLMHVYMDAVLYPNIYQHEEIFRQEGWSYKLDSPEGELQYNGVVYNEMKGAFSSPESVLDRVILNTLFPDTSYANESGGDPEYIPDLTYEQFLDFHRKYYHPSNSYIYLYGNMDMDEKLEWLDREYLCHFDKIEVDSEIRFQEPFGKMVERELPYSIASDESEADNTYLSYNKVIGTSLDRELYLAFQILDYALLSAPGAPLKKALTEAGIGKDIMGSYDNGVYQPIFSVISKNANAEQKEAFVEKIEEVLKEIVENGMDKKALEAGINYHEFRYREADFGSYPKGLMYGLQMLDSWLYDDEKPFIHIEALDVWMNFDSAQPHLQAAFDFIQWVFHVRVNSAESDKAVGVFQTGIVDKVIDALYLPGNGCHRLHHKSLDACRLAALKQGFYAPYLLHGNRIEVSHAVGGLFGNFIGINMGVKINHFHGNPLLSKRNGSMGLRINKHRAGFGIQDFLLAI